MKFSILILFISFLLLDHNEKEKYKLIAHRGGVVGSSFTENSAQAIEQAARKGYWMVEIDIRQTRDGQAVVQHDANFERYYQDSRRVEDMSMEEIKQLQSKLDGAVPLNLEEMLKLCKQYGLKIMLDTKAPHSTSFLENIEASLSKFDLLTTAYIIGTPESRTYFKGKAKVGVPRSYIKKALSQQEKVSQLYFLFEHGNELDKKTVRWAQNQKITIVPSVNKFHYRNEEDMMEEAKEDIDWLKESGVSEFQIDSEFDQWF